MEEVKVTVVEKIQKNKAMENLIISWGLPDCLKVNEAKIIFKFDDAGLTDTNEKGYHCKEGDVKFCLYDDELGKVLFSMEFFKTSTEILGLLRDSGGRVTLYLLYVHDESLRKKGISSYYFNRLRDYAIREKVECIRVKANANDKYFKKDIKRKALNQEDLEKFYLKRSTPEVTVKLI